MLLRRTLRISSCARSTNLFGVRAVHNISRTFRTKNALLSDTSYAWQLSSVSRMRFHTSTRLTAQSPSADAVMENLNDLYSTAKDEFEIAAEETEKKTVYAADDREAAKEALGTLKEAFQKALKESDPEVAKEVQGRVGSRIRELENAVIAMEEMAMED